MTNFIARRRAIAWLRKFGAAGVFSVILAFGAGCRGGDDTLVRIPSTPDVPVTSTAPDATPTPDAATSTTATPSTLPPDPRGHEPGIGDIVANFISPDGRWKAFSFITNEGTFMMRVAGVACRLDVPDASPYGFSPDGNFLFFVYETGARAPGVVVLADCARGVRQLANLNMERGPLPDDYVPVLETPQSMEWNGPVVSYESPWGDERISINVQTGGVTRVRH